MRKKVLAAVGVLVVGLLLCGILLGMRKGIGDPAESKPAGTEIDREKIYAADENPVQTAMPDTVDTPAPEKGSGERSATEQDSGEEREGILEEGAERNTAIEDSFENGEAATDNPEGSEAVGDNPWSNTAADDVPGSSTVIQNAERDIGDSAFENGAGIESTPGGNISSPSDGAVADMSDENSSSAAEQNHEHCLEKIYWYGEPSCVTANNYYNLICSLCGENGGTGTDTVPHTPQIAESESREGCTKYRILEGTCLICGITLDRQVIPIGTEHDMITGQTGPVWDEALQDFVTHTVTYCSRCGLTDS